MRDSEDKMTSGDGICGQQSPGVLQLLGERGELIAAEKIFFFNPCRVLYHYTPSQ